MDISRLSGWLLEQCTIIGAESRIIEGRGGANIMQAGPGRKKWRMVVRAGEAVWTDEPEVGAASRDALFQPGGTASAAKAAGDAGRKADLARLLGFS